MAVIGATIVAFGTSLPELVVSLGSSIKALQLGQLGDPNGPAAMAIGNVVGSNIFNIGAILGLTALLTRVPTARSTLKQDYPIMLAALIAMVVVSWLGSSGENSQFIISSLEGGLLFTGLIVFTVIAVKNGKVDLDEIPEDTDGHSVGYALLMITLGILGLTIGGDAARRAPCLFSSPRYERASDWPDSHGN